MITSASNRRIKLVRALQSRRRAREKENLFVVEGLRWAREVVAAGAPAQLVLHTDHLDNRGRGLVHRLSSLGAEVLPVSESVMGACSDTEHAPGLLVVLPIPQVPLPESPTLAVVVDQLRDPGNLGALLRTSLAAGVEALFLTPGTVDAYNPKVVRAAMGAQLRLPIRQVASESLAERLAGLEVWLAQAGRGQPYHLVDWVRPVALIIGGEAAGADDQLAALAGRQVHIPMPGEIESLNVAVAAGILLFEIVRQRGLA